MAAFTGSNAQTAVRKALVKKLNKLPVTHGTNANDLRPWEREVSTQYEREEDQLITDLNEGRITRAEFNKEMQELQRAYQGAAEEAAQDAYEREMERW